MNFKKILSVLLTLIMVISMMPCQIWAATDLTWNGGTITLASGTTVGSATLTALSIYKQGATSNYPEIASATQDGTTTNITLAEGTDPSYPLQMGFSAGSAYAQQTGNTCTLKNGKGTATVAVQIKAAPAPNAPVYGTGTFTVNFSVEVGEVYDVTLPDGEGFTFDGETTAGKNQDYSFKININEGYDGSAMVVKVNENVITSNNGVYTVTDVTESLVITVEGIVKKEVLTITKPTGDGFTFTGADTVYKNEDYTFTISVDNAFDESNMVVKANGTVLVGNNGKYTISAVGENIVITVEGIVAKTIYTVTLTEGEGYTLSGQATSYANEPYTFTVSVDDAIYWADKIEVLVDSEKVTLTNGKYTFDALDSDKTVTVQNILERQILTVTKPEVEGVTVSGDDTVREGKSYTFTVSVDEKYDGTNMVVTVNGNEITSADNKYTVDITTEDITIEISGIVKKDICEIIKPADGKFTFTGEEFAYKGNDYVFTVTPNLGYLATVTVNGVTVEGSGNTYTVKAEGDELVINVTTQRVPLPEKEIGVSMTDGIYTADVSDNALKPFSSYHATVTGIKISGAQVASAFESGTAVYFILRSDTPDNVEISLEFLYTNKNCNLKNNTLDITLKDGEGGVSHTVTADYNNGWKTKSATYNLIFFREIPAEEPPLCIKNSDTKEVWKDRNLEIDLSEYFTDADSYYLINGDEKTVIEGKIYTFTSGVAGEHSLVFSAENEAGFSEQLTITVNVKDIESGIYIGNITGNGSLNFVQFMDSEGELIAGIEVLYDIPNRAISVVLPKDYSVSGTVNAKFDLTQNESGYPFASTSSETIGNRAFNSRFTEKNIALTGGSANFTFYYYNKDTGAVDTGGQTKFTISFKMKNDKPALSDGISPTANATITAGENYTLDLSPLFTDIDEDLLTYKVSVNGASPVEADSNYTFTTDVAGTYTLVFTANDSKDDSADIYTVTLTVENSEKTDSMTVYVPDGLSPVFYVASGFEDGIDKLGDALDSIKGESYDGMTTYTVNYPVNAEMISVRTEDFGGMAFNAEKDGTVSLRKTQFKVVDYDNNDAASTNNVTYSGNTAVAGIDGWLLVVGNEYVFTAAPQNADLILASKTLTMEAGVDIYIASIMLGIKNPMSITVPTGAKAQLYKFNQYYSNTEIDAKIIIENDNGTTTYQFIADTKANGASYIYRVSMEGKITKAGWLAWNQQNLTITYTENDKAPSYRLDDYSMTGEENSSISEDSVLLNGNSRNHMNLSVGESKTLKAYRAWEIIPVSYNNYIITPDFHYTVVLGNDVISLAEKDSPSAGEGDWMTLTALKEGIAIIEVTYDAIAVSGGNYDGVYGASDPNRSGLLVVQVGENNDASVKFGIDSFSSYGTAGSKNISYNPSRQKEWDSEFDTLYFTGNSGNLTLMPTASSKITEVSVSHDKGATWINLAGKDGVYNAEIIQGNNIIKVKTANGTAYQVVRGDKITVKFDEVSGKSNDNGIIEAGETIRVYLNGLHNPIPKMAGNYNPGYGGNNDGYSSQHLNYTCNGTEIYGIGMQYNFITSANYVEIIMPDDGSDVTLNNGYIGTGVIGLTNFSDGGDSHRNIPDNGCATRGSTTTYHTQSILPVVLVKVGDTSAPNNAPIAKKDAVSEKEIYSDQNFAINPDTLFVDADGDALTFTVSVNGGEAVDAPLDYKFTPSATGTYTLLFTATDGKETTQHTITLTVTNRPSQGGSQDTPETEDEFGLTPSEIAGYVTISFVDNGERVKGESGLKYPKPLGTIISATKVPYKKGEKITHVTKRLLDKHGIRMSYTGTLESGFYLGAICNFELKGTPYDSFGEFDAGVGSGWMITLNKTFIEYGASEFEVKNGDVIKWQYTCQLGKDIGDPFYSGSSSSSSDTNSKTEDKKEEETKTETPQKVETTTNVTENKATVTTTENSIKDAISKAEKENVESIVISSTDTKDATNITLEIPVSAAQNIAENSDLSLEVETASGNVSISNETLNSIVEQVGADENLKVTVEITTADKVLESVSEESAKVITENVEKEILQNAVIVEVNITSGDKHVRSFGGNTLTVAIPVEGKGHEEGKYYKVHIVSSDGKMDTSFGKCISKGGKLVIKVDTTHLSSFIVTDIETCPFGDIPNHWAYEAVKYVYANSLMQGTDEATFAPDENMSRAMLVTVLYRMANPEGAESAHNFKDVAEGQWYSDAVAWAATNGIVSGISENKFAPNEDITREQMALIIYRFAKMQGFDVSDAADLSNFADTHEVSDWALDAIRWANKTELVKGTSETTLSPKATATRAQVAAILMRFCENVVK